MDSLTDNMVCPNVVRLNGSSAGTTVYFLFNEFPQRRRAEAIQDFMDETSVFKKGLKASKIVFFKDITMMKRVLLWLFLKSSSGGLSVVAPAHVQFEKQCSVCEKIIQCRCILAALIVIKDLICLKFIEEECLTD